MAAVWQINASGFNSDEAVYAGQAAAIAGDPRARRVLPGLPRPPAAVPDAALGRRSSSGGATSGGSLVAAALGLATVCVVYQLGRLLYGRRAGLIAALLLALMPYHVVVTRQVLLDGPMTLFATLALYLLARFALSRAPAWLYAPAAALGLTVLSKETSIVLLGGVYAFFALTPEIRLRLRDIVGLAGGAGAS